AGVLPQAWIHQRRSGVPRLRYSAPGHAPQALKKSQPGNPMTRITGRAAFLQLLVDEGVTHLFGNPGTTELPIMEVVPDFPQLRFVLGLQESIVRGAAHGLCRALARAR